MELEIAILSKPGGRRHNEDACGHWNSERHLCCVLADGAGGHGGGDIASRLAVQHLLHRLAEHAPATPQDMGQLVVDTNRAVLAERTPGTIKERMHTTVALLCVDFIERKALWAHVGDSRLYWFRDARLQARTRDHSLVQALADSGLIRPEDMRTHPRRSELQSALGVPTEQLQIGVCEQAMDIGPGDTFLLCTDGLWEYVDEATLEETLRASTTPQAWLDALEATVLRNAAHKPNHDNYSALVVRAGP